MKKFLLLTTCISALSINFGSDAFSWSEFPSLLNTEWSTSEAAAHSKREFFPSEVENVEKYLRWVKESKDPEEALHWLDSALNQATENGKEKSKIVPITESLATTVKVCCECKVYGESCWWRSNAIAEVDNLRRKYRQAPEVQSFSVDRDYGRDAPWDDKYRTWANLTHYENASTCTNSKVEERIIEQKRQETKTLRTLKYCLEQIRGTLLMDQRRRQEEKEKKEDDAKKQLEADINACKGDGNKLNNLGFDYLEGAGGKLKDTVHAVALFKRSHDIGNKLGSYNLGLASLYGWGGTFQSEAEAHKLFREAYQRGHRLDATVVEDVTKHWNIATKALQEASQKKADEAHKVLEAQNEAVRLELEQCEKELKTLSAIELRKVASDYDANRRGVILGSTQQFSMLIKFYKLAMKKGDGEAAFKLGVKAFLGDFGSKNIPLAKEYFRTAYINGYRYDRDKSVNFYPIWNEATADLQEKDRQKDEEKKLEERNEYLRRKKEIEDAKGNGLKLNQLGLHYKEMPNAQLADKKHAIRLFNLSHKEGCVQGSLNYVEANLLGLSPEERVTTQALYKIMQELYKNGVRLDSAASRELQHNWKISTEKWVYAENFCNTKKDKLSADELRKEGLKYFSGNLTKDHWAEEIWRTFVKEAASKGDAESYILLAQDKFYNSLQSVLGGGEKESRCKYLSDKDREIIQKYCQEAYLLNLKTVDDSNTLAFNKFYFEATASLREADRKSKEMEGLDAKALTALGHDYEAGTNGKIKDLRLAEFTEKESKERESHYTLELVERTRLEEEFHKATQIAKKAEEENERRKQEIGACGEDKEKLYALAESYKRGINDKVKDTEHAVVLYKLAADRGHKDAAWYYLYAAFNGYGLKKDLTLATEYARIAFKLGYRNNCDYDTAKFFQTATKDLQLEENERLEVERKAEAERRSIELAKCGDDKEKLYELALSYLSDSEDKKRDIYYSAPLLLRAYELGHGGATVKCSQFCYYFSKDLESAKIYARNAFKLGYRNNKENKSDYWSFFDESTQDMQEQEALGHKTEIEGCKGDGGKLNRLGGSYFNGTDGKTKDQAHAVALFKLAHEAGNKYGSGNLGLASLEGWGGALKSEIEAYRLFQEAYKRGYRLKENASKDLQKHWKEATKRLQAPEDFAEEERKFREVTTEAAKKAEEERKAVEEKPQEKLTEQKDTGSKLDTASYLATPGDSSAPTHTDESSTDFTGDQRSTNSNAVYTPVKESITSTQDALPDKTLVEENAIDLAALMAEANEEKVNTAVSRPLKAFVNEGRALKSLHEQLGAETSSLEADANLTEVQKILVRSFWNQLWKLCL